MPQVLDALKPYFPYLWYVVAGLVSLLVAHRSQIDAWAESKPRLAGLMKILRAVGFDPWLLIQGFSLLVNKRLPAKVAAGSKSIKPPPLVLLLLMGLSLFVLTRCTDPKAPLDPCSSEALAAIQGEYALAVAKACPKDKPLDTCAALPSLKQERDARVAQWVQCSPPSPKQ